MAEPGDRENETFGETVTANKSCASGMCQRMVKNYACAAVGVFERVWLSFMHRIDIYMCIFILLVYVSSQIVAIEDS